MRPLKEMASALKRMVSSTSPANVDLVRQALTELDADHAAAVTAYEQENASAGENIAEALAAGDEARVTELQKRLQERRDRITTIDTARTAVRGRLATAEAAATSAALADRVAKARAIAGTRRATVQRIEKLLDSLAVEVVAANAQTSELNLALPQRMEGWNQGIWPKGFEHAILGYLAKRSNRAIEPHTHLPYEVLEALPTLVQFHDAALELALRPYPPADGKPLALSYEPGGPRDAA